MTAPSSDIIGVLVGASFAAGLNAYATIGTLGLLSRAGLIMLPQSLHLLDNWLVIGVALTLFVIEFFADKIPAFDLVWNALSTFIRVPVAALLAYGATAQLAPWEQLAAAVAGGLLGLAAHGGKTAVRAAVTPSPEPLSNIGLSLTEDALAIFLSWFATTHPYVTVAIVAVLVCLILLVGRFVWRSFKRLFRNTENEITGEHSAV